MDAANRTDSGIVEEPAKQTVLITAEGTRTFEQRKDESNEPLFTFSKSNRGVPRNIVAGSRRMWQRSAGGSLSECRNWFAWCVGRFWPNRRYNDLSSRSSLRYALR